MLGLLGTPFRSVAIHSIIDEGLDLFGGLFAAFRGEYPRNWLYNPRYTPLFCFECPISGSKPQFGEKNLY